MHINISLFTFTVFHITYEGAKLRIDREFSSTSHCSLSLYCIKHIKVQSCELTVSYINISLLTFIVLYIKVHIGSDLGVCAECSTHK
jgi:hypothetical protein